MKPESVSVVRTYLEMRDRSALRPAPALDDLAIRIERMHDCPASFWRYLYTEVGRAHHWVDRLGWTDDEIRAYLADPAVSVHLLTVRGAPAGYFELHREPDDAIELVYFGLLPEFTGRGIGRRFLTQAVSCAWDEGASRVWLHTNTLDHPAALPNYLNRGFTIARTESYDVSL
jgi:GNAT superfamily N-acetyltransferase